MQCINRIWGYPAFGTFQYDTGPVHIIIRKTTIVIKSDDLFSSYRFVKDNLDGYVWYPKKTLRKRFHMRKRYVLYLRENSCQLVWGDYVMHRSLQIPTKIGELLRPHMAILGCR